MLIPFMLGKIPNPGLGKQLKKKKKTLICDKGSKWLIGNNSGLSFWHDKWLKEGSFRSFIHGPLNRGDQLQISNICFNGDWNFNFISNTLPPSISLIIKATSIRKVI